MIRQETAWQRNTSWSSTHAEYHPGGTSHWSADAPIAPHYFPCKRCSIEQCTVCGRSCLTYAEAGGDYTEPRIRALDSALIVDTPPPD